MLIVPDGDADGLSSGVIAWRAVERLGAVPCVLHPERGEHVHTPRIQRRISALRPDLVLVLDMGSRAGAIAEGIPTVILDHHVPAGLPPGAILVSAAGRDEETATSALTWDVLGGVAGVELAGLEWLRAFGLAGDLGVDRAMKEASVPGTRKALSTAVALVNAANRSASRDIEAAFRALLDAKGPDDIAAQRVPTAKRLAAMREEVNAEVTRCSRTPPRFAGEFALLLFASGARVHPLVATRWTRRLSESVVIAANVGYLPGRVNFAMRSAKERDLISLLRGFRLPEGEEVAHGHARATGGSLPVPDFVDLLGQMGFGAEATALEGLAHLA